MSSSIGSAPLPSSTTTHPPRFTSFPQRSQTHAAASNAALPQNPSRQCVSPSSQAQLPISQFQPGQQPCAYQQMQSSTHGASQAQRASTSRPQGFGGQIPGSDSAISGTGGTTQAQQMVPPHDPNAANPFLKDLNLVAEAAKRAQLGILMRDMGDCAL